MLDNFQHRMFGIIYDSEKITLCGQYTIHSCVLKTMSYENIKTSKSVLYQQVILYKIRIKKNSK